MDDTRHPNDFLPLTIVQMRDLAAVVREEIGKRLSREIAPVDVSDVVHSAAIIVPSLGRGRSSQVVLARMPHRFQTEHSFRAWLVPRTSPASAGER